VAEAIAGFSAGAVGGLAMTGPDGGREEMAGGVVMMFGA